jgi:hypothetical protein
MNGFSLIAGAILISTSTLVMEVEFTSGTKLKANLGVVIGICMMIWSVI